MPTGPVRRPPQDLASGRVLTDLEPIRPTRGYRVHLHNGWLIDFQAEGMWPMGTQLELTVTTLVIGLPRQVAAAHGRGDLKGEPREPPVAPARPNYGRVG